LKDEFQGAYGVFQQDGLSVAANYSVLNFQTPNKEWKKVENFTFYVLLISHGLLISRLVNM
jgi:hypothetical protein